LSKDAEEAGREELARRNEINSQKAKSMALPTNKNDARTEIQGIMSEIETFSQTEDTLREFKFTNTLVKIFVEKNIRNMYRNRLHYQYKSTETKERVMHLSKVQNPDEEHELKQLAKETGFSKVIWSLSKHGKLVVGHNMLIDMMQILKQFFGPLPDQYDDFKLMLNSLFPRLIDTKYISSVQPLKDLIQNSTLSDLDKILAKEPFNTNVTISDCKYSVLDEKLHEAGYDAFLTGFCYIRMLHYLQTLNNTNIESINEHYSNKIHFMKSYDIPFVDLKHPQELPKRDHVFYIEFPACWETQDIYDLFSPFGNIYVSWLDSTSALVALLNTDNVKKVTSQLIGTVGHDYKVYFYKTYLNQISKFNAADDTNVKANGTKRKSNDKPPVESEKTQETEERAKPHEPKKAKKANDAVQTALDKPFEESVDW
jgi:poly(A)-specific ribonuclease